MKYGYERIQHKGGLPFNIFIHDSNEASFHWHREIEILLILKGRVNIHIQDTDNILEADDLILINSYMPHSTVNLSDKPSIISGIQIDPIHFTAYLEKFNHKHFICNTVQHDKHHQYPFNPIRGAMARTFLEYSIDPKKSMLIIEGLVNFLCYYINEHIPHKMITDKQTNFSEENLDRLKQAMNYIKAHTSEKLTLEMLAQTMHMNPYYFSHFFKDHVGIGFKQYIHNVRLDLSARKLLHSDSNIIDIASSCGFSNMQGFYKHFKRRYKCTPSLFRKKNKQDYIGNKSNLSIDKFIFNKLLSYLKTDRSAIRHLIRDEYASNNGE